MKPKREALTTLLIHLAIAGLVVISMIDYLELK